MRWGEIETYKFVKIYLRHEYLWNTDHENYKLKDKRRKAYQTIIKEFMSCTGIRLNEIQVRVKIKNLRSTYIQEIAKIRARSIPTLPYIPSIKWFSDWHMCFKHRSKKSLFDGLAHDEQMLNDELNNKTWITDHTVDHYNERNKDLFIQMQNNNDDLVLKSDPDATSLDKKEKPYSYKRKVKKPNIPNPHIQRQFRGNLWSTVEPVSQEDEFVIYGQYIASQLRKMNLEKALKLQLQIVSLISEARIAALSKLD